LVVDNLKIYELGSFYETSLPADAPAEAGRRVSTVLRSALNLIGNLLIQFGLVDRVEIPGRWKSVLIFGRRAHTPSHPTFKARSMNNPINPKRMVTKTTKSFKAAKYRKNGVTIIPDSDTYFKPFARFSK
jgi:hypothetical protein